MTAWGVAAIVFVVLLAIGATAYLVIRWQRGKDEAPRARVVTKDMLERKEIEASQKRKSRRQIKDGLDKALGGDE